MIITIAVLVALIVWFDVRQQRREWEQYCEHELPRIRLEIYAIKSRLNSTYGKNFATIDDPVQLYRELKKLQAAESIMKRFPIIRGALK